MSKIINQQQATLVLRTNLANTIDTYRISMSWWNINLQNLIGNSMWDKYDFFNIALVEVGSGVGASNLGSSLDDCNVEFVLTGLPFVNSRFYVQRQTVLNQSIVGLLNYNRRIATNQVYYGNNVSTFDKSSPLVNLSINYYRLSDETIGSTPVAFPHTCFIFKIVGIPKDNIGEIDISRRLLVK